MEVIVSISPTRKESLITKKSFVYCWLQKLHQLFKISNAFNFLSSLSGNLIEFVLELCGY
jgi:hypothetical protein